MGQRISGKEVEVRLSKTGKVLLCDEVNLDTASGITAANSAGYPNGWLAGEVSGTGEIKIDEEELDKLLAEADLAGSWEEMDTQDLTLFADVGGRQKKIEAFGVKLDFPDVKINRMGGEKITHTIPFIITGQDFVHIDGVRLARRL